MRNILKFYCTLILLASLGACNAETFSIRTFGRQLPKAATFWIESGDARKTLTVTEHEFSDYQSYNGPRRLLLFKSKDAETPVTEVFLPDGVKKVLLVFSIDQNNRPRIIPIREISTFNESGWLYLINATEKQLAASVDDKHLLVDSWNSQHLRFPDQKRVRILLGANDGQEWKLVVRSNIRLGSEAAREQQNIYVFIIPQQSSEDRQAAEGALTWVTFRETIAPSTMEAENES